MNWLGWRSREIGLGDISIGERSKLILVCDQQSMEKSEMAKAVRWGDNDHYFGPFTWHPGDYIRYGVILQSQGEESPSYLRLHFWRWTLCITTPNWLCRPHKEKRYPQWDEDTVKRLGRNWYWEIYQRAYGFQLSKSGDVGNSDFLQLYYGRAGGSMMDSSIEQRWSCFLPWTQWRHVRRSFYGLQGEIVATAPRTVSYALDGGKTYEAERQMEDATPTASFAIKDHDGEELTATTRIEEREWWAGVGYFKWLAWFRKSKIHRSLDIRFSGETGPEKGSWKGGTIGTSIEMLPGELHEAAFRRYCEEDHRSKHRKYRVQFIEALSPAA